MPAQYPGQLLGKGERGCGPLLMDRSGNDGREPVFQGGSQLSQSRFLEQAAQGQVDSEGAAYPGDELGGQQRVPSQLEEVVLQADVVDSEHLAPEGGQGLLGGRALQGRSGTVGIPRPPSIRDRGGRAARRRTAPKWKGAAGSTSSVTS